MLLSVSSVSGIVIDLVIIALVAILALVGLRKGFFKSVLSMVSTLVVIIISIIGARHLAGLINKIYDFTGLIAGKLCKSIAGMGSFYSEIIPEDVSGKDIINSIPSDTNGFLKKLMSYVLEPLSASEIQGTTVADIVSGAFASIIMSIIAGILLFIAIKIILSLASRLFENITRIKVFGIANRIAGFAFGTLKGLIIVFVFAIVLTLLTVIPFINTKISPIIQDQTTVAKTIYNYADKMMEKYIVDGKAVQKIVDNLWENKYDKEDDSSATSNMIADLDMKNQYVVEIDDASGVYIATIILN